MKVYCKNCKYNSIMSDKYCFYDFDSSYLKNEFTGHITYMLSEKANYNPSGDCPYYKRIWWKFWVK